jgi:hypothetical protein
MVTDVKTITFNHFTPLQRIEALSRRYWIFAGHNYYPMGGLDDLMATCDTVEEAETACEPWVRDPKNHWFRVYDTQTGGMANEG